MGAADGISTGTRERWGVAIAALILLALWIANGRAGMMAFPAYFGMRLYLLLDALEVYSASCLAYFALVGILTLTRHRLSAGGRRAVFAVAFAPVGVFALAVIGGALIQTIEAIVDASVAAALVLAAILTATAIVIATRHRYRLRRRSSSGIAGASDSWTVSLGLSEREREVALLLAAGKTNREIGERLFVSISTVKSHIASIFRKTGARNRTEVAHILRSHDRRKV